MTFLVTAGTATNRAKIGEPTEANNELTNVIQSFKCDTLDYVGKLLPPNCIQKQQLDTEDPLFNIIPCVEMLAKIEASSDFTERLIQVDEAKFATTS